MKRGATMNQKAELKLLTWYNSNPFNKFVSKFFEISTPAVKPRTDVQWTLSHELRLILRFQHFLDIHSAYYQVSL